MYAVLTSMKSWRCQGAGHPSESGRGILYRKYLMEQLSQFDAFVQARLEEPVPPMVSAVGNPVTGRGQKKTRLNAWMWKCRIEGAAEGVLAGKTVSYKDHIAVPGCP